MMTTQCSLYYARFIIFKFQLLIISKNKDNEDGKEDYLWEFLIVKK